MADTPTLRLPDAKTLAREVAESPGLNWHTCETPRFEMTRRAQRHLDALAKLVPAWVPVPDGATIPAGVRYRCERDAVAREAAFSHDISAVWRDKDAAFFVASADLDKLTYPDPDPDADVKKALAEVADYTSAEGPGLLLTALRAAGYDIVRKAGE